MTRTPGYCSDCGEHQPKLCRGMCTRCYARWHRVQKKTGTLNKFETVPSVLDRMRPRMERRPNGCIAWTGTISKEGYGMVSADGRMVGAHRVAYEHLVGPIPEGAWIDHACHNQDQSCQGGATCQHRRCVNPDHLEPVTPHENQHRSHLTQASKNACVNGHPFTEENTYLRPDNGSRACRECYRLRARKAYQKKPPRGPLEECKRGHRMTEENTYLYGNRRICRQCRREADKKTYWRAKG